MQNSEKKKRRRLSPGQYSILGFLLLITVGTLMLMLPAATVSGKSAGLGTASFTAVSSACVTGLVVEDTATFWSLFGQIVILVLIQTGGLGIMTLAVLLSLLIKRSISPHERMLIAQSLSIDSPGGVIRVVRRILKGTFIIEFAGAVVLMTQFIPSFGFADGAFRSIFISVSAFCNAGFDLFGDYSGKFSSLTAFSDNYIVNITVVLLIVIGGIGFVIWNDLVNVLCRKGKMSAYSKFVIIISLSLLIIGTAGFMIIEWNNSATIGSSEFDKKFLRSLFLSATTRTAGFNTVPMESLMPHSKFLSMILMFIGGASGSTAGGIKVGTAGLLFYVALLAARGQSKVHLFKRQVPLHFVMRALSLVVIGLGVSTAGALILSLPSETIVFSSALFESISAFATVGLSVGVTASASVTGRLVLMILMFFGRVGILTITFSMYSRQVKKAEQITYPEINMLIG